MKNWVKKFIIGVCAVMLTACAVQGEGSAAPTATASDEPVSGGTYIVRGAGDPYSFNPDLKVDDWGVVTYQNIFNRLVKQTVSNEVVGDLAESWEFSDDGLTLTFHLHEGVKWHDGEPFSSEDVKWTFDKIRTEGYQSNSFKQLSEITCPDENTVVFHLSEPNSGIVATIGWLGTFIMPKHIYDTPDYDWSTNPANFQPVGTGPFKFVSYEKSVAIRMERNEDYFKGAPYIDELIVSIIPDESTAFQAWQNGEVDDILGKAPSSEIAALKQDPNYNVYQYVATGRVYLSFNLKEGPFADVRVRQAVDMALDRQEILDKAAKGIGSVPETYMTPVFDWAMSETTRIPDMDREAAKKLIEEAGYTQDENGYYFTCTLDTFESGNFKDTATVVQAQLKEIGIEVKLNISEIANFQTKVLDNYNFDMAMNSGSQGPDANAIENRIGSNGSLNISKYANPEIDELLKQGIAVSDKAERGEVYKQIQEILKRDLPMVIVTDEIYSYPIKATIHNHPLSQEKSTTLGTNEFSEVWIEQ